MQKRPKSRGRPASSLISEDFLVFTLREVPKISEKKTGPAPTQKLVVKFDGEICGGVLVENASDDFSQ